MKVKYDDILDNYNFIKEFRKDNFTVIRDSMCEFYLEQCILKECSKEVGEIIKYVNIDNKLYKLHIDYMISYGELIITNVKSNLITNYFDDKKNIIYNWSIELGCNKVEISKIEEILKKYGIKINII